MSWQLIAIVSVFIYSVTNLLQKVLLREEKVEPTTFAIFLQITAGLILLLFSLAFSNLAFPNLRPLTLNIVLMAIFYGFGNIFVYKALKEIDVSKFSIITSTRIIFTVLTSTIFLSQTLNLTQIIGTILILAGVIIISLKKNRFDLQKGDLYALIAAILYGFAITNDKFLVNHFNIYSYSSLSFLAPALLLSVLNPKKVPRLKIFFEKQYFFRTFLICFMYSLAVLTFYWALQLTTNSSQFASINLTTVIVIVVLSMIFLKERNNLSKKILGAVLSFIGLLLVK